MWTLEDKNLGFKQGRQKRNDGVNYMNQNITYETWFAN